MMFRVTLPPKIIPQHMLHNDSFHTMQIQSEKTKTPFSMDEEGS